MVNSRHTVRDFGFFPKINPPTADIIFMSDGDRKISQDNSTIKHKNIMVVITCRSTQTGVDGLQHTASQGTKHVASVCELGSTLSLSSLLLIFSKA